jgi:hypothetical protein
MTPQQHGRAAPASPAALSGELSRRVDAGGAVPAGVDRRLREELGWGGRMMDVLAALDDDVATLAFVAGGRRPDEVAAAVGLWAEAALSLEEIGLVLAGGGYDPDPFVALARAGLLERLLRLPDGSPRRVHGELAGRWVSDELALADDDQVVEAVGKVLAGG